MATDPPEPDPAELHRLRIRRVPLGYAVGQVDDLLDRLAAALVRRDRRIDELRSRLRDTEARLAASLEGEAELERARGTARDAVDRAMADAREQADELRAAAEREVTGQLEAAREQADELRARAAEEQAAADARLERLRRLEEGHRRRLREHLEAQLAALASLEEASEVGPVPQAAPVPPPAGATGPPASDTPAGDGGRTPSPGEGSAAGAGRTRRGLTVRVHDERLRDAPSHGSAGDAPSHGSAGDAPARGSGDGGSSSGSPA